MRLGAAVAVAGTTLVLAGCGDGRLSHGDFVKRADAVCSAYDSQVQLLTRPRSFDAIVAWADRTLPLYVAALDRLRALKPATGDESAVRSWLAANREVVAAVRRLRRAAMQHAPGAADDASAAIQAASLASRRAAAQLGLQACSAP